MLIAIDHGNKQILSYIIFNPNFIMDLAQNI